MADVRPGPEGEPQGFTSFPGSSEAEPRAPITLSHLYDRMRSGVSQVFGANRDGDSGSDAASLQSASLASPAVTPAPASSLEASVSSLRAAPPAAMTASSLSTTSGSKHSSDAAPAPASGAAPTKTHQRTRSAVDLIDAGAPPRNSTAVVGVSNVTSASTIVDAASLWPGHTSPNSSGGVGAPVSPGGLKSAPPSPGAAGSVAATHQPMPVYVPRGVDASDVDSLFSVGTPSLSRAYLASQSSHSRKRSVGNLSRDFWMKDENASSCFRCGKAFTTFRRRHHCRVCGHIFCSSCTSLQPGARFHQKGRVRCCVDCLATLDAQLELSEDDVGNSSVLPELETPSTTMPVPGGQNGTVAGTPGGPDGAPGVRFSPSAYSPSSYSLGFSRSRAGSIGSIGMPVQSALTNSPHSSPSLMDERRESNFALESPDDDDGEQLQNNVLGMAWQSATPYTRPRSDTNRSARESSVLPRDSTTTKTPLQLPRVSMASARFPAHVTATVELNKASLAYAGEFLDKILTDSELVVETWHDPLNQEVLKLITNTRMELVNRDRVDPSQYVKLKAIPGGRPKDIESFNGIAFTHNVALKTMSNRLKNPRILLVSFPIEYSRGDDAYMSLGPVLAQETEYLRKLVARIEKIRPNMLLSSSRISGTALNLLDAAEIVVASNVGELALERLSRYIKTDILATPDRLSMSPFLGTCELFEVRSYKFDDVAKTFMFFKGLSDSMGNTVLIRGPGEELGRVKVVVRIMVDVMLSLKMETALMRDQFVSLPELDESPQILSSSPFTDYGQPYLRTVNERLEDTVVTLTRALSELQALRPVVNAASKITVEKETVDVDATVAAVAAAIENDETITADKDSHAESEAAPVGASDSSDVKSHAQSEIDRAREQITACAKGFNIPENKLPGGIETALESCLAIQQDRVEAAYKTWMDNKHQWEMLELQNPYMFNPSSHQSLVLTFSLINKEANFCAGPESLLIEFYLDTDLPLGQFVETTIQSYNSPCPEGCPNLLGEHRRSYFHGNGVLNVSVEEHPSEIAGLQNSIIMWSKCKVCGGKAPYVPMSPSTWKYSLGKYLELSFWGTPLSLRAGTCPHNIYRDHVRYFGWLDKALRIEYADIELHDVYLPKLTVSWDAQDLVRIKSEAYKSLSLKIKKFWNSIQESLSEVKVEGLSEEKLEESEESLKDLREKLEIDRRNSFVELDAVYLSTSPTDSLSLNKVLQFVQDRVVEWHEDLTIFDGLFFPTEKDIRRVTAQQLRGFLFEDEKKEEKSLNAAASFKEVEKSSRKNSLEAPQLATDTGDAGENSNVPLPVLAIPAVGSSVEPIPVPPANDSDVPNVHDTEDEEIPEDTETDGNLPSAQSALPTTSDDDHHGDVDPSKKVPSSPQTPNRSGRSEVSYNSEASTIEGSTSVRVKSRLGTDIDLPLTPVPMPNISPSPARGRKVSLLARHFEELSKEFERERQREHQRLRDRQYALTMSTTQPVADVFQDVHTAVNVDWDLSDEPEVDRSEVEVTQDESTEQERLEDDGNGTEGPSSSEDESELASQPAAAAVERKSLIQSFVNFWAERSSTRWSGIEYVLAPGEHLFSDSPVLIRDAEPSSLIAFCLSIPDYVQRTEAIYADHEGETVSVEQVLLKQTGVHMRYQCAQGATKLACKIFFGEQFDALRRQTKCDTHYIQSLSRCTPWETTGGKSGSSFLKTIDDRLIIKELSQTEFDALATFLPSYFEYMAQALFHDLPTALAKIFGIYQIQIYNPTTSKNIKLYVMVSENLFFRREFTRVFDLKGSMRNRRAAETGRANEVLLDENMVDYIYNNPMYVREYSKKLLRTSLYNDTLFLTKMNVMDYSLVLGIDEEGRTISAGIIDFVRTFTWDKKVESWVKGRAAGGGVKEPTVISPKQYKVRFRESMERYFLLVPDCWVQVQVQQ